MSGCVDVIPWVGYQEDEARNFACGGGTGSAGQSYSCYQSNAGDPVDPVSGDFSISLTDFSVPEPGPALTVSRSYDSQSPGTGSLGPGWSFDWDTHVVTKSAVGTTDIDWGDGRVDAYTGSSGTLTPQAGNFTTLTESGSGYVAELKNGTMYTFSLSGALDSVADVHGNTLTVADDASGRPETVTDSAGRKVTFARTVRV